MPIPLPNLDTRRWADLVDEGRALVPRYARQWTDHNYHDPGITLIELFAWLIEQLIYRANRVPERHLRKFLGLVGVRPEPPRPAAALLSMRVAPGSAPVTVPADTLFLTRHEQGTELPFELVTPVTVVDAAIVSVQVFDGTAFADRSRAFRDGLPLPLFGDDPRVIDPADPARMPAVYLGFDRQLPLGVQMSLYVELAGIRRGDGERLLAEVTEAAEACARPPFTCTPCLPPLPDWCDPADQTAPAATPATSTTPELPPHHSVRTVWEYFGADNAWHPLSAVAGDVVDETRSFTLDGFVRLRVGAAMGPTRVGALTTPLHYVRCRFVRGAYDATPILATLHVNAGVAEQTRRATHQLVIAPGVVPAGAIAVGAQLALDVALDADGVVRRLGVLPPTADAPRLRVLGFKPPTVNTSGSIDLDIVEVGAGTGLPTQHLRLADAPITRGELALFSTEGGPPASWRNWRVRDDLDASTPADADVMLDAATGETTFGDGVRARLPLGGSALFARYASTRAASGNVAAARTWKLADGSWNHAVLAGNFVVIDALSVANRTAARGGDDAETIAHAAGRAAEALWAHERLVEIAPLGGGTLDQVDRATVLERAAPWRLTTVLDAERIALEVPGTVVRRARAWADVDPNLPCADAVGTITLVIVPELPRGRPSPSPGLLRAVRRYLDRRRVLCTRLVVVGPEYLDVTVRATVRALPSADRARVEREVVDALALWLDPLRGGPAGNGWPFGRDVYRSEVLNVIDAVAGVDHVVSLTLSGGSREADCGNLCVPPTWLVASGTHDITVVGP
jgi:predicted phage baseplate assembly protein